MIQSASLLLAAFLPLLGNATRVDVAAGGELRVGGGRLPIAAQREPEFGSEATLTLQTGVRTASRRTQFLLTYMPRLYLRLPNVLGKRRPLVLHQLRTNYDSSVSRRLGVSVNFGGAVGEVSYSGLDLVFDPGTGAVDARIIPMAQLNGGAQLTYAVTRDHSTSLGVNGGYRAFLEEADNLPLLNSQNVSTSVRHSYGINPRQLLTGSLRFGYIATDLRDTNTLGSRLGLRHGFSERTWVTLGAGVNYAWDPEETSLSRAFPSADASYSTQWHGTNQVWNMNLSAGVDAFFDQTALEYRPQAFFNWATSTNVHQDINLALNLFATGPITSEPAGPRLLQTQAGMNLPVQIRLTRALSLQLGAQGNVRGPHPSEFSSGNFQEEIRIYIGLAYVTGTGPSRGNWL